MLRGLTLLGLMAILLAPGAAAFPAAQEELFIAYAAEETPALLAAGALRLDGTATGGLLVGGVTATKLEGIPTLTLVDRARGETTVSGATIEFGEGALLWTGEDARLALDAGAPYALGLGLPDAPIGDGSASGFLLAGEGITGAAEWTATTGTILPLDALVTVRDARGSPVPGWDNRRVNQDATASAAPEELDVVFTTEGDYTARLGASLLGGTAGEGAAMQLHVAPAEEDRLAETVGVLAQAGEAFFGSEMATRTDQLAVVEQISGILNGAILVVPGGEVQAVPRESRFGEAEFPLGQLTIVRGEDMRLAWEEGEMRVAGEPTVALGRDGFAVEPPATVGIFPVVSVVLWLLAVGALVAYFVKRPPEGRHQVPLRILSAALWLLVLAGVFFFWDKSFEQSFGAGVVSTLREGGFTGDNVWKAGVLLMLESVPWGVAGLLFALPVRIALGVGLRYLGRGKSFKGLATAGGLLALALFGPTYALWCFNLVWSRVSF